MSYGGAASGSAQPEKPLSSIDTRSMRSSYSKSQLEAYMILIQLPEPHRSSLILTDPHLARDKTHGLPFLTALMRFHLAKVPYENLALHYSSQREPSLNTNDLFHLMVGSKSNRGGHCLQLNSFFANVLRGFGFQVTTFGARVNTDCQSVPSKPDLSRYNGWDHMVIVVELSGERYLVDVGMKSQGPMVPILLQEGISAIPSIPPRSIRIIRDFLPELASRHPAHQYWQLQQRYDNERPWSCIHAFPETEFLPADFEIINWYVSTHPTSWLTHKVTAGKMLLDENGKEIIGDLTLHGNVLKKRLRGRKELEITCRDESERILWLREYFGISLNASDREYIRGTMAELA